MVNYTIVDQAPLRYVMVAVVIITTMPVSRARSIRIGVGGFILWLVIERVGW